jgi:hypothetical protein
MAIFQVLAEACIGKCQYWKSEGCALHLAKLRLRRKFISPQAPTSPQYDLGMTNEDVPQRDRLLP